MLPKHGEDPEFLDKIVWTGESTFKNDGFMNMRNLHYYALNIQYEKKSHSIASR